MPSIETIWLFACTALVLAFFGATHLMVMAARKRRRDLHNIVRILEVHGDLPGLEIARLAHVGRGIVYVYLTQLEEEGVVTSRPLPTGVPRNYVADRVIQRRLYGLKR